MQIDAVPNNVRVRVGQTFGHYHVEKLREAFVAFAPFSSLDIDFAAVRQCDDSALARLAGALRRFDHGVVRLRGLSVRQRQLVSYAGLDAAVTAAGGEAGSAGGTVSAAGSLPHG